MTNINELSKIPDINFVNTDVETLLSNLISGYQTAYENETGEATTLYPGDKQRIWLNTAALKIYQILISMDLAAKQNLLKYSKGGYLDNLGATRHSLVRDTAKYASVPVKMTLSQALTSNKTIPAGTRVTAGDDVFFALTQDGVISSGQTENTFVFTCTEAGDIGNDYSIGLINTLVDPVPFVQSVQNTEVSQGGADVQSDDSFTQEIWEAPEGYAVAGPEEAYIFRTKQFSQAIDDVVAYAPDEALSIEYTFKNDSNVDVTQAPVIDNIEGHIAITNTNVASYVLNLSAGEIELHFTKPVSVFKGTFPRGGIVNIAPLLSNATIPTETFLNELKTFLSADKYRPLTDKVETIAPVVKEYSLNFKYWINSVDSEDAASIQAAVNAAVADYITWQGAKLSRDINPDELTYRVKNAGAKRLEITSPVYTELQNIEIAKCTTQSITYEGLEG